MFFVVERPVKFNIGRHLRSKIRWRSDIIKAIIYRYCIDCHFNMFIYKVLDHSVSIAKFTKNSTLQKQPALRRILNAGNCVSWLSKAKNRGINLFCIFYAWFNIIWTLLQIGKGRQPTTIWSTPSCWTRAVSGTATPWINIHRLWRWWSKEISQ